MANQQLEDDRPTIYAAHIMGLLQRTIEIRRGFGSAVSSGYQAQAQGILFPFLNRHGTEVQFTKLGCDHTPRPGEPYNLNECDACGALVRDASMEPLSIHVPISPGLSQGEVMARIHVYKTYDILLNMTNTRRWRRRDPSAPLFTAGALLAQIDLSKIHLCFTWVQLQARHLEATHVPLPVANQQPTPMTESYSHYSSMSTAMLHGFLGKRKRVIDCIVPVCRFF
jgi:hypothetical protein